MTEGKKLTTIIMLLKILGFLCYMIVVMFAMGVHEETQNVRLALMLLAMGLVVIEATRFQARHMTELEGYGFSYDWLEEDHYSFSLDEWEKAPQEVRDWLKKYRES